MPLLAQACTLCANNSTLGVVTKNYVLDTYKVTLGVITSNIVFDTKTYNPVFDTNKPAFEAINKVLGTNNSHALNFQR